MPKRIFSWLFLVGLLLLGITSSAQYGIRAVVVNEILNIRFTPAIGAEVIGSVNAGYVFETITARSGDGEWLRVDFECNEGWINLAPIVILQGDINVLPLADPRSIPYGGFEAPRAGFTNQVGAVQAAATDGLRVRLGPSTAYPTIANINFNQLFTITGRNACNNWYQVTFEGTLGWVSAGFFRIISGDITTLPVDGVVAETLAPSTDGVDDYISTLRLMLARLELAQPSLNQIRASWTDSALTGRAVCQNYPAQPSDFHIPTPLLAAQYGTLNPLLIDFNIAMFNVRQAIDLFIEVCNQPGTGNPVGQATVQGALNILNDADNQFASLRQRLNDLIPELEVGPEECLLQFNNKFEIVPRIGFGAIYGDNFSRRTYARGYCFEGIKDQLVNLQALPIPPAQLKLFIAISPITNPTDFLVVLEASQGAPVSVGPLTLPVTGTYLLILADLGDTADGRVPYGDYAFLLQDMTFATSINTLLFDEATQSIILQGQPTSAAPLPSQGAPIVCPNLGFGCSQLFNCGEAGACLAGGNFSLDINGDGIPCNEPGNLLLGTTTCTATP
jgi:hypothetical protein